ncbi:MAG: 50S ribosomal protein L33 [Bacilli bacterium]|jgi:large subunit ribosomal protein L33|nr:50S ribosomal protein L33 [Bacilli bacterium]MDD3388952.1 50S ribosomal protein L33 [Bacilli bacterium]MDD4344391.1 50S ribosomal protein L33 [Bacilli bacterium]MDD4520705.1 50S ribosomal protein L33 [Bacilli bacterium]MDY0399320.1 50S ribosomal protein L33 [Bacilli bacterium]
MREKVLLICSECLSRNYTTTRAPKTVASERLERRKYCPRCGRVTLHKESR